MELTETQYHVDEGVAVITLNRPDKLNAWTGTMDEEVYHCMQEASADEAVRVIVLTGAGRGFCAGADIGGFAGAKPWERGTITSMFETVNDFPKPTIAKIDGFCLGGGHELALACDLRVATTNSEFGFPEINLGLLPGGGGTQRTMRMIGEARAKELVFRGERISAEKAEDWGLINRAVDKAEFDDVCAEFVDDIVEGPPVALDYAKKVMNRGEDASLEAALTMESQGFGLLLSTEDVLEGTSAFAEDRDPEFEGK
jgi:enoyl-CoA hydratase/3-hydroxyacyl-CoA dehydrogenase